MDPIFSHPLVKMKRRLPLTQSSSPEEESASPGPDAVPAKLLKELAPEMSKSLVLIFQTSFVTGCLPSKWESATISPLFKGGSRVSANKYGPVNLTSICCKIKEKITKKASMQFLGQHHLLSDTQHGFRSGTSCLTNLLFSLERWTKARDEGNVVNAIYIDFTRPSMASLINVCCTTCVTQEYVDTFLYGSRAF
ncbi:hypothetical protein SprV_0100119800 [Sparganum proliferum]